MNTKARLRLAALIVLIVLSVLSVVNANAARKVKLRPLGAEEVVKILRQAGREDAIPEGRVVTQGLAAMTGFALGLTKGIGGSLLFDLATSNATAEFINNFNATAIVADFQGINMTALTQMLPWVSANNAGEIKYKKTEICFDTISENLVLEQKARRADFDMAPTTSGTLGSYVGGSDDGASGSNTHSSTTTQSDDRNRQTCLVFIKPILRKRRSLLRKRRQ